MATDCAEAATAVIILLSKHVLQLMMDNVLQKCGLSKNEQQH